MKAVSFAAAYSAALRRAEISRATAALRARMDPAAVTRMLNGEQRIQAEHARALLAALEPGQERDACLLFWIREQLNPEDAQRITLASTGKAEEPTAIYLDRVRDDLDDAADAIRRAAKDGNTAARKAMISLARAVDPDPPDKTQRHAGGGPLDTVSKSA